MRTAEFKSLDEITTSLMEKVRDRLKALDLPEETMKELAKILEAALNVGVIQVMHEEFDSCLSEARRILNA